MSDLAIDADFWPLKATAKLVAPYVDQARREWMRIDEQAPVEIFPESQYFVAGPRLAEAASAEDPVAAAKAYLDAANVEIAVVNPGAASSVSGYASGALGAEMARAVNEWTIDCWLTEDSRLAGSIVVSPRDPGRAAEEIARVGRDLRMAQVLLAYPQHLLGSKFLHPIYEAACECALPVTLQAGGAYAGANGGLTVVGSPSSTVEAFVSWEYAAQAHLVDLVMKRTFERFPTLRIVLSGFGVAWLPSVLWRLDHEVRAARSGPLPSLERLPSELVRDHVRFTGSPLELPAEPAELARLLASVGGDGLLLYASGAVGDDDVQALLAVVDDGASARIRRENALATYRLMNGSRRPETFIGTR
jgi:predicted TIM-barrel fold metal-dependent hydrolase